MKRFKRITTEDIEYANERLMNMSKDELDELEKSPNHVHLTEDDIRKVGELLAFKKVKKEKRNTIIIAIIAILILLFNIIFILNL
ncbi:hypothetical protein M0Q97_09160 [Candidatus Dojkabacteria bacterium]|jgi:REP element-mobilizing transposase RayT|nr:hypothetical protein [Candidatus Dojkabacteria bacterium]